MVKGLRSLSALGVYPLVLGGACALWSALISQGLGPQSAALATQLCAVLVIWGLEYALPHSPKWQRPHDDRTTDAVHMGVSLAVSAAVVQLLRAAAVPLLASQLTQTLWQAGGLAQLWKLWAQSPLSLASALASGQVMATAWPHQLPLPVQLGVALVLAEGGAYISHRLLHRVPHLWPFHAVHHSAQRLYFLNTSRNHPLDMALSVFATFLPLSLLGMNETAFALFSVFTSTHLLLQHSNIAQRTGPLSWILATAEVHRWHHSRKQNEADANYGQVLMIWDVLFGTRRVPAHREPPLAVGFDGDEGYPRGYLQQLGEPFRQLSNHDPLS